jgi:tetratricopeptide (TPR) repeat protein
MPNTTAKTIFVSYAHEDDFFRQELEKHLQALYRQKLIEVWHDRNISAGTDWTQQMREFLDTADIILLLISPDFLSSDYRYSVEMVRAMERHKARKARVIPIILRPVIWEGTPFAALQSLPDDDKPVTAWPSTDAAFLNVAENIGRVVRELQEIDQALSHMAAGHYDQALAAYERILQFDRHSAAAYAGKGDALLALGQMSKALDAYGQALLLDPTHPASESGRGATLLGLKRYQEALLAFTQAISLDPTVVAAYRGKGDALSHLHRYEEALEAYDKALRLNSEDALSYVGRGRVLEQLARQAFEEAKQLGYSEEKQMEQGNLSHTRMPSFSMKIENLALVQTILPGFELAVMAMSPDGKFLAGIPNIGKPAGALLWDVETGEIVRTVGKFTGNVSVVGLPFSADGQALLCHADVFEMRQEEYFQREGWGGNVSVVGLSFSADGQALLCHADVFEMRTHYDGVFGMPPQQKYHHVGCEGWEWNVKTDRLIRKLPRSMSAKVQYSKLEGIALHRLLPYDIEENNMYHRGAPLAYSPDGKMIVGFIEVGLIQREDRRESCQQMLILWDASTGKILHMMSDMPIMCYHPITITGMAISPDTQLLASGYNNGVIKLWSLSTTQLLYTFVGHESLEERVIWQTGWLTNSLRFSPDGRQIVSAVGGEIKIWEIDRLP